jgi:hypothetical protein
VEANANAIEPHLYINDRICIYLGYIEKIRPVTHQDLAENRLLRVFTGIIETMSMNGSANGGTNITIQCRDTMKWLMESVVSYNTSEDVPILDTSEDKGVFTKARSRIIINLAKRSVGELAGKDQISPVCDGPVCGQRIDSDTSVIYDAEILKGALTQESEESIVGSVMPPDAFYVPNTKYEWIVRYKLDKGKVDKAISNHTLPEGLQNRVEVNGEYYVDTVKTITHFSPNLNDSDLLASSQDFPEFRKEGKEIVSKKATAEATNDISLASDVKNKPAPKAFPRFHIMTGRLGYGSEDVFASSFQVVERTPIEYIKVLASQETYPTEVFVDHRTGDFYYTPRVNDISGLQDPARFYRTYYYRSYPAGIKPHSAQMMQTFKDERSSISFASNIIVQNARTGLDSNSSNHIAIHLRVIPWWLADKSSKGHKDFACRYYIVTDPSLTNKTEAAILAAKFARISAKEVRAGSMSVLGDPSLCPGEAIQLVGSPFSQALTEDGQSLDVNGYLEDRQKFIRYNNEVYNPTFSYFQKAQAKATGDEQTVDFSTAPGDMPFVADSFGGQSSGALLCQTTDSNAGQPVDRNRNSIRFIKEPQSMYRIAAVSHRFNDSQPGFFTETYLISPF